MTTPMTRGGSATREPRSVDDTALHARAHDGGRDAYEALLARHVHAARRLARHLRVLDDVEAVVADAFAAVVALEAGGRGSRLDVRGLLFSIIRDRVRHASPPRPARSTVPHAPIDVPAAYTAPPVTWSWPRGAVALHDLDVAGEPDPVSE